MSGLITVIVPVYNAERTLPDCLRSILGQTCPGLEVLLVDDGSTDRSAALCREWEKKDERIRFLQKKNGGVSSARNLGLQEARGDYITFVDADDWIFPDMLQTLLHFLNQDQSGMAMCGFLQVGEAEREQLRKRAARKPESETAARHVCVDTASYVKDYLLRGNTRCWSILYDRRVVEGIWFQEGLTIGEDMLFLVKLLGRLERVSILGERAYCYYSNGQGAMLSGFKASYMDQIACWQQAREKIAELYPGCLPLADACLFQASLLVADKLAVLSAGERRSPEYRAYQTDCLRTARESWNRLKEAENGPGLVPAGNRVKGRLYLCWPGGYMWLYHLWRMRRGLRKS